MAKPIAEPQLELVCEAGEEPDVTDAAAKIFIAVVSPGDTINKIKKDAILCREIALILAGFIHEPWADSYDQEEAEWHVLLQYQRMPLKSKTYRVTAKDKDTAVHIAQLMCKDEFDTGSIVQQINGNDITEEAK